MLAVATAAALWGALGTAITLLGDRFDAEPLAVATIRAVTATVLVWSWLLLRRPSAARVDRRDLPGLAFFALITVTIYSVAIIYNFRFSGVRAGTMLLYLAPAFVTIVAATLLGERISPRQWMALLLTVIGCAAAVGLFDVGLGGVGLAGLGFGIASAVTYGSYSLLGKHWLERYSPLTVIAWDFLFGALGLVVIKLVASPTDWPAPDGIVSIAVIIGVCITLAPWILYTIGLKGLSSSKAATLATLEPVVALALATFVLDEPITVVQGVGAALVIAGLVLLAWGREGSPPVTGAA